MNFKKLAVELLSEILDLDKNSLEKMLQIPPKPEMGDFAFPCFQLTQIHEKTPNLIAEEISNRINKECFEKIENIGPYVNFYIDKKIFIKDTIQNILSKGAFYGRSECNKGKSVCIQTSCPNIIKLSGIESLSLTVISKSLYRIFQSQGYDVITSCCDKDLGSVMYSEFQEMYKLNAMKFDSYIEECASNKIEKVIEILMKNKLIIKSNGADVVELKKYNMPPFIVRNIDGTYSSYIKLLTCIINQKNIYRFDKNIHIAELEQRSYYEQVLKVMGILDKQLLKECKYFELGLVKLSNPRCFVDENGHINIRRLEKALIQKTLNKMSRLNIYVSNKEEVSRILSIGAVNFFLIKNCKERQFYFDLEQVMSLEGDTGAYVLYTYSVGNNILRNNELPLEEPEYSKLYSTEEFELIKLLDEYIQSIDMAINKLAPNIIAEYCIQVSKVFNKFVNNHEIENIDDEGLKCARLNLVRAACQVIKNSLALIGVDIVEKIR